MKILRLLVAVLVLGFVGLWAVNEGGTRGTINLWPGIPSTEVSAENWQSTSLVAKLPGSELLSTVSAPGCQGGTIGCGATTFKITLGFQSVPADGLIQIDHFVVGETDSNWRVVHNVRVVRWSGISCDYGGGCGVATMPYYCSGVTAEYPCLITFDVDGPVDVKHDYYIGVLFAGAPYNNGTVLIRGTLGKTSSVAPIVWRSAPGVDLTNFVVGANAPAPDLTGWTPWGFFQITK